MYPIIDNSDGTFDPSELDGFADANGTHITNPFFSDNGFDEVNPIAEYGDAAAAWLARHPNAREEIGQSCCLAYLVVR